MDRVVILGGGESGVGAAVLAKKKGYEVFLSDRGKLKAEYREVLCNHEIEWEEEKHSEEKVMDASIVVKSPGIPDDIALIMKLKEKEIEVISEIEWASRFTDAKIIAITGSNGKTTTSMLIYHILKNAGLNVGLAGNIGDSFALQVAEKSVDFYVLELSSFQLDGIVHFRPDIAILLNITADHLDRYGYDVQKYAASKFRIAMNQTNEDVLILNGVDNWINKERNSHQLNATIYTFSLEEQEVEGAYYNKNKQTINININNNQFSMSIHDLALQGKHNTTNSMAAGIASRVLEIRKDLIRESLSDFQNVEHRLEFVAKVHGISFINDSKATNVNSTWYALESLDTPVIWIVGGVDKGNDYSELESLVKQKVRGIICLGSDNGKLLDYFDKVVDTIEEARTAEEAVTLAYRMAKKGEAVILSPACASFDLFDNYEDRGNQFKHAVKSL